MNMLSYQYRNPIVETRWSYDGLISSLGFLILIRRHLFIESGPRCQLPVKVLYCFKPWIYMYRVFVSSGYTCSSHFETPLHGRQVMVHHDYKIKTMSADNLVVQAARASAGTEITKHSLLLGKCVENHSCNSAQNSSTSQGNRIIQS